MEMTKLGVPLLTGYCVSSGYWFVFYIDESAARAILENERVFTIKTIIPMRKFPLGNLKWNLG